MRLLVTRPEPDASALAEELRALGHEPVLQPLLEFESVAFDPARLRAGDALIITSANGLRALQERGAAAAAAAMPVFCVGEQTACRLREAGFDQVKLTAESAEALSGTIATIAPRGARFVHVTGEHQAFDLAASLKKKGFSVQTLRVYTMRARQTFSADVAGQIREHRLDGALLMSPRTAEIFKYLCDAHNLQDDAKVLRYFCLADSVAEKLKPLGAQSISVAARPNRAELIALLEC